MEVLQKLINSKQAALISAPDGSLRATKGRHSDFQYYYRQSPHDKTGIYIKKENIDLAAALAQKQYDKKVLNIAEAELAQIDKYLQVLRENSFDDVYEKLPPARQALITPVITPDERYVSEWLSREYPPGSFGEADGNFYSTNGLRVRSKAEVMIADMLEYYNIPFRYEYPIYLKGYGNARPDFLCLNRFTRREYFWEHFGMMDSISYANNNIHKLFYYEQNGYYAGENMILTFETSKVPLDSKTIKNKIRQYLLH